MVRCTLLRRFVNMSAPSASPFTAPVDFRRVDAAPRFRITERVCPFCKGSGCCNRCEGRGHRAQRAGWFGRRRSVPCIACSGRCTCELCRGVGVTVTVEDGSRNREAGTRTEIVQGR